MRLKRAAAAAAAEQVDAAWAAAGRPAAEHDLAGADRQANAGQAPLGDKRCERRVPMRAW